MRKFARYVMKFIRPTDQNMIAITDRLESLEKAVFQESAIGFQHPEPIEYEDEGEDKR